MHFHTMTPNDVKIVADNIDDFIEVPDGVSRLRKAVLTLAVSGKLVPQVKKEGTADELYAKIQARPPMKSEGRKKKASGTSPLTADETPYEIPTSWKWVRLGEIVTVQTGTLDANASSPDGVYPFFTCADEPLQISRYAYDCECVLLAGNGNFNVKYYKGKFEAYQRTYIIEAIDKDVFVPYVYLLVQMQTDRFKSTSLGSAMPYIRLGYITEAIVSLPPFLEQKRIVQKVEELLKQLDELEARKNQRDAIRTQLTHSAMAALVRGETKLVFENLVDLVKTSQDVEEFGNSILGLATAGRLMPQNPKEKSQTLGVERVPLNEKYTLPQSWCWATVSDVGNSRLGKMLDKDKNKGELRRYLGGINVRWADFDLHNVKEMRFEDSELEEFRLHAGDVLVCEGGEAGRAAIWDERESEMYFQKALHRIRFNEKLDPEFFLLCLRYDFNSGHLGPLYTGVGIKHLTGKSLAKYVFPLPPLPEQNRIVAKVAILQREIKALSLL